MIVTYKAFGTKGLVFVPDTSKWEILSRSLPTAALVLVVDGAEYPLADADGWCQGRALPISEIESLYDDTVDRILQSLTETPDLRALEIEKFLDELLEEKYVSRWAECGYITLDENGDW